MPWNPLAASGRTGLPLLLVGTVGLMVCALLAGRLWPGYRCSATQRAWAHFIPIAAAAAAACVLGHAALALGLVFGCSVASMSNVIGFITLSTPLHKVPADQRALWRLLPVVTLLVFVVGLHGYLGLLDAALLGTQGLILLWLAKAPAHAVGGAMAHNGRRIMAGTVLAAGAVVAAWAALRGTVAFSQSDPMYTPGVIAVTLLSIVLVLPMIGGGLPPAWTGSPAQAVHAQVLLMVLNLCLLLPLLIVLWKLTHGISALAQRLGLEEGAQLLLPRTLWRIDSLGLVGLSLVVMAAGTVMPIGRRGGAALIFAYGLYIVSTLAFAGR